MNGGNRTSPSHDEKSFPEDVVSWLKSDAGRTALTKAIEEAQDDVKKLNDERKIPAELMHEPITL